MFPACLFSTAFAKWPLMYSALVTKSVCTSSANAGVIDALEVNAANANIAAMVAEAILTVGFITESSG
jgi:hypothetical protein